MSGRRGALRGFLATTALAIVLLAPALSRGATDAHPPVLLQADEIEFDTAKNIVTAKGSVEISSADRVLLADSVTYNRTTGRVTADGHVSLLEANGDVAFADHVALSDDLRDGALEGFSALIGQSGRMVADSAARRAGRYTTTNYAVFTPCRICREEGDTTPLWQVRAARVTLDGVEHELTFQDATFDFAGVPVFYLPRYSQPDPTVKHKSGFLLPEFGSTTNIGSFVRIPYHLSFSASQDATLMPLISTNGGDVLQAEYRERWLTGGMWLQGSLGYEENRGFKLGPTWVSHLFGSGRTAISDHWRAGFDVQLTSDDTYMRRYDISNQDRLVSDLFVDSVVGRTRAAITGYFFQSLRSTDPLGQIPYVMPQIEYNYIPNRKVLDGRLRADASLLSLFRNEGRDTTRASLDADWRRPFVFANGQMVSFEIYGRSDLYRVADASLSDPTAPKNSYMVGRGVVAAAAKWEWPFVNGTVFPGSSVVINPIVQLVLSPRGGNDSTKIPNEDSTSYEFDTTNLFSINKLPGLDRWSGGSRVDAGVHATALLPLGTVEAEFGQEYRLKPDPLFAADSGLGRTSSDFVGVVQFSFGPYLDIVHSFRIDESSGSIRRNEIYVKGSYGRSSIDLSYLNIARESLDPTLGDREEINALATLGIAGNWSAFAGIRRNLQTDQMITSQLGVVYEDECFLISLGFERKYTSDPGLPPASSVILHFGLKTGLTGGTP